MITRSIIELHHDAGYGDNLLSHVNSAIRGKDMIAQAVLANAPCRDDLPVDVHPVQKPYRREQSQCPTKVTMAAYEVYCHLYGQQAALVTGECRGGMSAGELIAFLYARSFPKQEWSKRVDEAFRGMVNL